MRIVAYAGGIEGKAGQKRCLELEADEGVSRKKAYMLKEGSGMDEEESTKYKL